MTFPAPSARQSRILWFALTALAVAVFLAIVGVFIWGLAWILKQLTAVLLPLAVAGILAYLLDPLVDLLERWKVPRLRAIFLVFFLGVMIVLIGCATIVPQLVLETQGLIETLSKDEFRERIGKWLESSKVATKAREAWDSQFGSSIQEYMKKTAPVVSAWLWLQMGKLASWFSLLIGFALVPVYLFYFLLEKRGIQKGWTTYLPLTESRVKNEVVFVINAINDYLIVFFRGQVLVALIDGILLTVGFLAMGLNYAFLLGMIAGVLSIVPFLGVALSLIPALILAAVQFGDWWHPGIVLAIFAIVQLLEGFVVSPKIMGDRVGLHPLTIIVAVMVGTTLMGGIIGGILAIPLTAALRVLMFRYVWRKPDDPVGLAPR